MNRQEAAALDAYITGHYGEDQFTPDLARPCIGFAAMTPEQRRAIASKGGKAAHAKGTAHQYDATEAQAAGRKGGAVVSRNREHMARIGRRGGEVSAARRREGCKRTW